MIHCAAWTSTFLTFLLSFTIPVCCCFVNFSNVLLVFQEIELLTTFYDREPAFVNQFAFESIHKELYFAAIVIKFSIRTNTKQNTEKRSTTTPPEIPCLPDLFFFLPLVLNSYFLDKNNKKHHQQNELIIKIGNWQQTTKLTN